jgi:DNA repair protein REV1
MGYADELQAVSVDEALIDVTSAVAARANAPEEASEGDHLADNPNRDPAIELAEKIRADVRGLTEGCEGRLRSRYRLVS